MWFNRSERGSSFIVVKITDVPLLKHKRGKSKHSY